MPIRFHFRWIPFIAALIAAIIGVSLGNWQMRRAEYKEGIEHKLSERESAPPVVLNATVANAEEIEFRRVQVTGEFVQGWPVYLDNRPHQGRAGFHLVMPLKIAGTNRHVLVIRGWMPRDPVDRNKLVDVPTPGGVLTIEGTARRGAGHLLQLGTAEALRPGAIVQNLDVKQFEQATRFELQPLFIEQTSDVKDGLVRDWPRPSAGVDKHMGYAFQWYGLAVTALIFFVVTGIKRGNNAASQ
ncbi:MAG: SURF1 family protein [Burkholderiaceae bacterium]